LRRVEVLADEVVKDADDLILHVRPPAQRHLPRSCDSNCSATARPRQSRLEMARCRQPELLVGMLPGNVFQLASHGSVENLEFGCSRLLFGVSMFT
jgi:hypothetical protein